MRDRDEEDRVLRFLDRGLWKHSWHLPRWCGGFDWINQMSVNRVRNEVEKAREQARWLLNEAANAEEWANQCQRILDEESAEDEGDN